MSPPVKFTKSKKEKAGKRKPKAEIEDEELQEEPPKVDESVLAAHFGGQTSKYIHGRHGHYLGSGLIIISEYLKIWDFIPLMIT